MHRFKIVFLSILAIIVSFGLIFSSTVQGKQENNDLMPLAILGTLGSISLACYEGKVPCTPALGINTDKLTFSLDNGADRSIHHLSIAVGADWRQSIYEAQNWKIAGRLEASLHQWNSTLSNPKNSSGYMLSLSPIFQYQPKNYFLAYAMTPYIEMGSGPYLLDNIMVENEYKSTQIQFGSIFGLGIKNQNFEISYRYLHISNANIELPNPGLDLHNLHIGYYF